MASKRASDSCDGASAKKRKTITLEMKVDIIKRSEQGQTPTNIGKALNLSRSTIGTIIKDKKRIMDFVKGSTPMQSTVITKQRSGLIVEMEKLLVIWIDNQNQRSIPLSLGLIQEKARSIFNDLKARMVADGTECTQEFTASHGWFNRFKGRANYHNIRLHGEAASCDEEAGLSYPAEFEKIVKDGGYTLDQIFNVDETGLFWKKMPTRTYIAKNEKTAPGHKAGKDRLSLLLGGNASGDYKIKPLLIYRADNPRVFARRGILKSSLPVHWRHNKTAWCDRPIFLDWFLNLAKPELQIYCKNKGIPFKILLCIDNCTGHPATLDTLCDEIKVVFLPKNTTPLLQPMDQGVIATFKAYYLRTTFAQAVRATDNDRQTLQQFWSNFTVYDAVKNIGKAWDEISEHNMRAVWKKLLPSYALDFGGFSEKSISEARETVVRFGQKLDLEIDEDDVIELLESHAQDLTNEDLMELERQIKDTDQGEGDNNPEPKVFVTKELAEAFRLLDAAMAKFEEQDGNSERYMQAARGVYSSVACYQAIFDERKQPKQQQTLDSFIKRGPRPTTPSSPVAGPSSARDSPPRSTTPSSPVAGPSSSRDSPSPTNPDSPSPVLRLSSDSPSSSSSQN